MAAAYGQVVALASSPPSEPPLSRLWVHPLLVDTNPCVLFRQLLLHSFWSRQIREVVNADNVMLACRRVKYLRDLVKIQSSRQHIADSAILFSCHELDQKAN